MLNNAKLTSRIRKMFKILREKWGITTYRIAVETDIPHSSLKYMMDEKFDWKLNHLLSFVDFLNRNNVKISIEDLLDFENKKSFSQIMNLEKADFRQVIFGDKESLKKFPLGKRPLKPKNFQEESEGLTKELTEIIRDSSLIDKHKISLGLKISGKNFDFHSDVNFSNGKLLKN